jgi:hypothetical protein
VDENLNSERTVKWHFEPYFAWREDVPGERVYRDAWRRAMAANGVENEDRILAGLPVDIDPYWVENEPGSFPIKDILGSGVPDARDTRLASSVIRWLGCHMGQRFLEEVQKIAAQPYFQGHEGMSRAFLAAWAIENRPDRSALNGSFLIAADSLQDLAATVTVKAGEKGYMLSPHDMKIFERTMMWLGSPKGQNFIRNAQDVLTALHKQKRAQILAGSRRLDPGTGVS